MYGAATLKPDAVIKLNPISFARFDLDRQTRWIEVFAFRNRRARIHEYARKRLRQAWCFSMISIISRELNAGFSLLRLSFVLGLMTERCVSQLQAANAS